MYLCTLLIAPLTLSLSLRYSYEQKYKSMLKYNLPDLLLGSLSWAVHILRHEYLMNLLANNDDDRVDIRSLFFSEAKI